MSFWMVRAGEQGRVAADFERLEVIALGWGELGDLARYRTLDAMRTAVASAFPSARPGTVVVNGSTLHKFKSVLMQGDRVVTYDPNSRQYLVGTIVGDYEHRPELIADYPHIRRVRWQGKVSRDSLSVGTKNSLGSIVTLFQPGDEAAVELEAVLAGAPLPPTAPEGPDEDEEDLDTIRLDAVAKAREFLKDRLLKLAPDDMEVLVASLLRAMGYKARVTPKGPDRGRDVIASPDGLGLQAPRISVEVKHRPNTAMGSSEIRSFLGGIRDGDCGLYVSTGGFTKEAHYEADRATVPTTLIDLESLAELVVENYERFDAEGRALVPMVRLYWPSA